MQETSPGVSQAGFLHAMLGYIAMDEKKNDLRNAERRMLPFFVEFVKFATAFAAIVAIALFTLSAASAAMQ